MKDSLLHALDIGTLAVWLSMAGFTAVALCVKPSVPETVVESTGITTQLGKDFTVGETADAPPDESPQGEIMAESAEPLPAPPSMPRRPVLAPLPELPDPPPPVGRTGAGASISARLAAGSTPGPVYPPAALPGRLTGTVVVQFTIAANGSVSTSSIYTSSGWRLLDDEALRTVRTWKFPPGEVMSLIRPIVFQLPTP